VKMFDAGKTRMIGLPYGEKNCDNILSRFHLIPERYRRTDRQTDRIAISKPNTAKFQITYFLDDSIAFDIVTTLETLSL